MSERLRVYVAGPLSDADPDKRERKVADAMDAGIALMKAGFAPLVPHLTHFLDHRAIDVHNVTFPHADWMAVDLPWLDCADAVLRLPGASVGADMETERADELNIPVYYSLGQLVNDPPARRPMEKTAAMCGQDFQTKDSGERRTFATGSRRDTATGKGRYDLLPPYCIKRLAQLYERGAAKYGDRNWQLGQPLSSTLSSLLRHAFAFAGGMEDEDHLAAVAWNAFTLMWTQEMIRRGDLPAELNDMEAGS